jgi:hypothetical protein
MGLTNPAAFMDEIRKRKFWPQNLKGGKHSGELCIEGRIILKWILREIGSETVDWIYEDVSKSFLTALCH